MLVLLFIIFVVLFILGSIFINEDNHEIFRSFVQISVAIGAAFMIMAICFVVIEYSETITIDKKIEMYTEENKNIENNMDILVNNYMNYESNTLSEFKGDSSITLISLYPDLKSNELVKTQIETYRSNNEKLKELKEKKIDARIYRWLLYFGK